MNTDKLEVLQEMYSLCIQNRKEEKKKIQTNLDRISEIDGYIKSIKESEEADFKIFSPRSSESIYGDRIRKAEGEKEEIENDNRNHYQKINQIDRQIEQLTFVLNNTSSAEEEQKHLTILDIQEKERQRIARELHDSSVQDLTHLVHSIELSSMYIDTDPIRAKLELEAVMKQLKSVIDEMRETIFNLRPMSYDDLGFRHCLDDLIINLKSRFADFDIIIDKYNLDDYEWNTDDKQTINIILLSIYRIIQEAVMNALLHSGGNRVVIDLVVTDHICKIAVTDNGKGFLVDEKLKQKEKHFGISIMQERASLLNGRIDIRSQIGSGTKVKIRIPLNKL